MEVIPKITPVRHVSFSGRTRLTTGFTLLEVLIVVGIIAVLLALLMPALAVARERAWRAECASNLRQQGVAFWAYAQDHADEYPAAPEPLPLPKYGHWAYPFGAMIYTYVPGSPPTGQALLYAAGYIRDAHILYCPSSGAKDWVSYDEFWDPNNWYLTYVSYPCWASYQSDWDVASVLPPLISNRPGDKGDRLLSSDMISDPDGTAQLQNAINNHLQRDGTGAGGNILYNDGSVRWLYFSETTRRLTMVGVNFRF